MSVRLTEIDSLRVDFCEWLADVDSGVRTASSVVTKESGLSELLLGWMQGGGVSQVLNYEAFVRSVVLIVVEVAAGRLLFGGSPIQLSNLTSDWWMLEIGEFNFQRLGGEMATLALSI